MRQPIRIDHLEINPSPLGHTLVIHSGECTAIQPFDNHLHHFAAAVSRAIHGFLVAGGARPVGTRTEHSDGGRAPIYLTDIHLEPALAPNTWVLCITAGLYSCRIGFDRHLGHFLMAVEAALRYFALGAGDVIVNDDGGMTKIDRRTEH